MVGGLVMRKLVSCLVVCFMLLTSYSVVTDSNQSVKAANGNQPATFIANRFVKVGFNRDGLPLYPTRMFPWQTSSDMPVWGRPFAGYPNAKCRSSNGIRINDIFSEWYQTRFNFPAQDGRSVFTSNDENLDPQSTDVIPVAWTDMYLSVIPAGGDSQECDHWYVVLDSAGQLWFDPDGTFHDSRINPFTHPKSPLYDDSELELAVAATNSIGEFQWLYTTNPYHDPSYNDAVCKRYGIEIDGTTRYCIDPISNNNTQGPYIINDFHNLYGATQTVLNEDYPSTRGLANWQFMDNSGTRNSIDPNFALTFQANTRYGTRKWQIGWVDMVDYPPQRKVYDANSAYENRPNDQDAVAFDPTIVEQYQWDVGLPLVHFRMLTPNANNPTSPKNDTMNPWLVPTMVTTIPMNTFIARDATTTNTFPMIV